MRIAYISFEYPPDSSNGGIATYVAQASRIMASRGHEVEVFAASPARSGRFPNDGILEHWIWESNRANFAMIAGQRFAERHAEKPFDVLEGPEYNADGRRAVELVPQIPLVVKMHTPSLLIQKLNTEFGIVPATVHLGRLVKHLIGSSVKLRRPNLGAFRWPFSQAALEWDHLESEHARKASIVAPPCQDLCLYAQKKWNVPSNRIRLSPHPYTPNDGYLQVSQRGTGSVVGFVGRLERRKGIETLAQAIPTVLRSVPDARFRFVGAAETHRSGTPYDIWLSHKLPQMADRLEFIGKVPLEKMADAYADLDVVVLPSIWENFPNVCLEAMSAARAVVASSAGGMREMLDRGGCGRLVSSCAPGELAQAIVSLLRNPSERIRLGKLARQRVLAAYNADVFGARMEEIFNEAIIAKIKSYA